MAGCIAMLATGAAQAGNPAAGKEKSKSCAACHGADGNSASGEFPRLAGQHYDYLLRTLQEYKSGERKNAIMNGIAGGLSNRDMQDLAAFYSRQQGLTVKR
ncbi:MAG: cytochrome c [Betaproteobacteria bacterium]|nr:cytochrome c [Betaproteobacteria bacterium]